MTQKYSLKYVKAGKPFCMPKWTVAKHKAALEEMLAATPDLKNEERDDEYQYYIILQSLRQIDNEVTIEDLKDMHPEDLILLFNAVYNAGRSGILFQNGEKPRARKKKSTGKKD